MAVRKTLMVLWLIASCIPVAAQTGQEKSILEMTKANWVAFRDYGGRQLIYFTHLEAWRCGIARVAYSINDDSLGDEWQLQPCDPEKPNEVTTDKPYLSLPEGSASSIAVRLTFSDGTESETQVFRP